MPEQEIIVKEIATLHGLGARDTLGGTAEIPAFIGDVFAAVMGAGLQPTGAPVTVYHDPEFLPESIDLELVIPVPDTSLTLTTPSGRPVGERRVPGGTMAVIVHVGPYETSAESYQALGAWTAEHGYATAGPPQEIYLTGPDEPGPPVTEIRLPVTEAGGES